MEDVYLSGFVHKNEDQIKVSFDFNYTLKEYIKKHPLIKWSKTHKTFYLPFTKQNANNFYSYLKKNNYSVNYRKLVLLESKKLPPLDIKFNVPIKDFENWLIQMRYSKNTIKTYISMISLFFRYHYDKNLNQINKKDIEAFNSNYIIKNGYSFTFQNQLINAIKLFYKYNTKSSLDLKHLDRPKKSKKLPEVLSLDEVKQLLSSIKNVKHKTLLSLLYSCGLRIGEAINLKIDSINLNRSLLHIKSAKGRKDRVVPISPVMADLLIKYMHQYKPKVYLFEGQNKLKYSAVSSRQVLKRAIIHCGVEKNITLHTLRHSYATHLLENGTDIRFIQELLGHNSPKTTMIYTHVSTTSLEKIKNPFDDFNI